MTYITVPRKRRNYHSNTSKDRGFKPLANVLKGDKGYQLSLAVPGFSKEEISITNDENGLLIEGKKEVPPVEYVFHEFNHHHFSRRFSLPENIDKTKLEASHENGVLIIDIPFKPKAEIKKITIK